MKAALLDSPSSPPVREVSFMEPTPPSSPPARRWRLTLPVSLGVLLLLASLVVGAVSLRSHAGPSPAETPSTAASADGQRWFSLGYVDLDGGRTPLYPMQPGRVRSIEARENEPVKAGQPLFHMEDTEQALKVRQAEAARKAAQEQLAVAEARVEEASKQIAAQQEAIDAAKIEVDRARLARDKQRQLRSDNLADKEAVQNAELLWKKAQVGVRAEEKKLAVYQAAKREAESLVPVARANIDGKQAQLDEARYAVSECVVRAPVDGMPLRILITRGQVLGSNPRQPAIEFAAERPLLVRAELEQEFVGRVQMGQNVIVQDHVTGQECARGKVVSLAHWYAPRRNAAPEMLSMNNDVRTLECIVKIESTSQEIRIGQRVRVQFPE